MMSSAFATLRLGPVVSLATVFLFVRCLPVRKAITLVSKRTAICRYYLFKKMLYGGRVAEEAVWCSKDPRYADKERVDKHL